MDKNIKPSDAAWTDATKAVKEGNRLSAFIADMLIHGISKGPGATQAVTSLGASTVRPSKGKLALVGLPSLMGGHPVEIDGKRYVALGRAYFPFEPKGRFFDVLDEVMSPSKSSGIPVDTNGIPIAHSSYSHLGFGAVLGLQGLGTLYNVSTQGYGYAAKDLLYAISTEAGLISNHFSKGKAIEGVLRPGLISGMWLKSISRMRRFANTASYIAKSGAGGIAGHVVGAAAGNIASGAVSAVIGEGLISNAVGFSASISAGMTAAYYAPAALVSPVAGGAVAAGVAAYGGYRVGKHIVKEGYRRGQERKAIHTSGDLAAFHTQGAYTMRARAVSAIHKSHMNARSALGSEANFMHMPSRNYHSKYRRTY